MVQVQLNRHHGIRRHLDRSDNNHEPINGNRSGKKPVTTNHFEFAAVTAVALDRYTAIFYPFYYRKWTATKRNLCYVIAVTWLLPIPIVAVSFATSHMTLQQRVLAILAPFAVGISIYVQFKTVRAVNAIRKREMSLTVGLHAHLSNKERRKQQANRKSTKVATMILVTMIACYLPQSVLTIIRMLQSNKYDFQGIYDWTKSLVLLCSMLNPIIYCLMLTEVRKRISRLFRQCKNNVYPVSNSGSNISSAALSDLESRL
eukprot:gene9325-10309_t